MTLINERTRTASLYKGISHQELKKNQNATVTPMLKCLSKKNYTAEWLKLSDQAIQISALSFWLVFLQIDSARISKLNWPVFIPICYLLFLWVSLSEVFYETFE